MTGEEINSWLIAAVCIISAMQAWTQLTASRNIKKLWAEIYKLQNPPVIVQSMGLNGRIVAWDKAEDGVLMDAKKFADALPQFEGIKRPLNIDPVRMQQLRDEADERWEELQRARRADGQ